MRKRVFRNLILLFAYLLSIYTKSPSPDFGEGLCYIEENLRYLFCVPEF